MLNFYKSHGKHCYYRSFQAKCPRCGLDVLYWECRHGCKVFFNYPPYGKLIQHRCSSHLSKNAKKKYPVIVKTPKGLLEEASPSCPVCGKLFKTESDLDSHIKQLEKNVKDHNLFLEDKYVFSDTKIDKNLKSSKKIERYKMPKFGTINIRKRNQ